MPFKQHFGHICVLKEFKHRGIVCLREFVTDVSVRIPLGVGYYFFT